MTLNPSSRSTRRPDPGLWWAIGGLVAVVLVVVIGIALTPYYSTIFWWELRKAFFWLIPLAVGAIVCVLVTTFSDVLAGVLAVLGVAGLIWYGGFVHSYDQDADYATSVRAVPGQVPTFAQRAPFEVATAQAGPDLGRINGDTQATTFLPATGKFGTPVEARGFLTGYQAVLDQTIPLTGRGQGHTCTADTSGAALSGNFGHNLGRRIAEAGGRWLNYSTSDSYAFCDQNDHPIIVVPLKEQDGFFTVTERPAGVAVYDAKTQALELRADPRGLPGPSYPLSLASTQRASTPATSSFSDWLFSRAGYDLPPDENNSAGPGEFVLGTQDQGEQYTTPLTYRGSSSGISVLSTLPAQAGAGGLAPLTVHQLDPGWLSITSITQRIRADYQDIPNWQNLAIYEVVPVDGNRWVATIGNGQNVLYRVTGLGVLGDPKPAVADPAQQPTCLEKVSGDQLNLLRCNGVFAIGGNGPGVAVGPAGTTQPGAPSGVNLATVPSDQLIAEVQRRLAQTGTR